MKIVTLVKKPHDHVCHSGPPHRFPLSNMIRRQENLELMSKVESIGPVNYGSHMFDWKDILSPIYLDGNILKGRNLRLGISAE